MNSRVEMKPAAFSGALLFFPGEQLPGLDCRFAETQPVMSLPYNDSLQDTANPAEKTA